MQRTVVGHDATFQLTMSMGFERSVCKRISV
jgi:hypothetical protein